jgi:hypothetical protein
MTARREGACDDVGPDQPRDIVMSSTISAISQHRSDFSRGSGWSPRFSRVIVAVILGSGLLAPGVVSVPSREAVASTLISQIGADIKGAAAQDQSGWGVSMSADGSRVAVGAIYHSPTGKTQAGHVRVYDWNGSAWIQVGADIVGEAAFDRSGQSVSLSADGSRVAIGAPRNGDAGADAGQVRVYDWNGTDWVQVGGDIDGGAAGDLSGLSVSLSGDGSRVAIGAPNHWPPGKWLAGRARIYDWDGTKWVQVADFVGAAATDRLGWSVSLSADGTRIAIGAKSSAGYVRVHHWNGTTWIPVGSEIAGEGANLEAGASVSLSAGGSRVAIGAPQYSADGKMSVGRVRVHEWNGTVWAQVGGDIAGDEAFERSGTSVSLGADGSRVAIGAPDNDGAGRDAGSVRVYDWDGAAWAQTGGDIIGVAAFDISGTSVSLSSDGSRVAIGAPWNSPPGKLSAGHVRVWSIGVRAVAMAAASSPSMTCSSLPPVVGVMMTCTVTGGDPGIDILWRVAYNPVFAEAGVTLDGSGTGEFAFVLPAAALGEEVTVELVEWLAPVSLGVVGGPVPGFIPAGSGPEPVAIWSFVMLLLAGGLVLRRMTAVGVRS